MTSVGPSPLNLFFWAGHMTDGCFKYRIDLPARALRAGGHNVAVNTVIPESAMDTADVVIGQRIHTPGPSIRWQLMAKRRDAHGSPRLVYDIDDDLLSIDPRQNRFAQWFKNPVVRENMKDNMRCADLITVSTEPLAEVVGKFNPNVTILPNCLESSIFDVPLASFRGASRPFTTLGWQGSATHDEDWKTIQPVVSELTHADSGLRVRFLGTAHPAGIPPRQIDFLGWTSDLAAHYKRVTKFDIGLAPLNDTLFNRSKSGLRFTEYAALGVPSVCADVPAYRPWVAHGETGFLARTPADWRRFLLDLIGDPQLRLKIGDTARERAREWAIDRRVHLWEGAYRGLL